MRGTCGVSDKTRISVIQGVEGSWCEYVNARQDVTDLKPEQMTEHCKTDNNQQTIDVSLVPGDQISPPVAMGLKNVSIRHKSTYF